MPRSKQPNPDVDESPDDGRPELAPDFGDWSGDKYEEYPIPQDFFWLQDADKPAVVDGPFDGREFLRDEDSGAYYSQTEGRPIFLRIVHSEDNEIWTVDGANQVWHYLIV